MRLPRQSARAPRRGIILLVVLTLLTLFAIVGIAFVFYSQSRADAARLYREAQLQGLSAGPDVPPDLLFADWLRQFIWDVPNAPSTPNSAMRGHSLARGMYGYMNGNTVGTNLTQAYNGVGRQHGTTALSVGGDEFNLINYTNYAADGTHNPEVFGRANINCTYPDLNNMFLAAVRNDGTVLMPSYHRPWTGFGNIDPTNPNWNGGAASAKYQVLRPRTAENPQFPLPGDLGGDVKNLTGCPGGNDSIWMDIGAPVLILPDGRMYKPIYAALVTDLDNRINLNVHGNIHGAGKTHASNLGFAASEISILQGLGGAAGTTDWMNLFSGNGTVTGRYGNGTSPTLRLTTDQPYLIPSTNTVQVHSYGSTDFDGANEGTGYSPSGQYVMPGTTSYAFPTFNNIGYGNGHPLETTTPMHPAGYNVYFTKDQNQAAGSDRSFDVSNTMALLRDMSTTNDLLTSDLGKLCPNTFISGANAAMNRRLATTTSWDMDVAGVTPFVWDPTQVNYQLTSTYPTGTPIAVPTSTSLNAPPANSEFSTTAYGQSIDAVLAKLDLNQTLPDYPLPGADGSIPGGAAAMVPAQQARQTLAGQIYLRLVYATGAFNQFTNSGTPTQQQMDALRWLAQLSANIVDYIDVDDYMTPFNYANPQNLTMNGAALTTQGAFTGQVNTLDPNGKGWVFGTELPRLLVNEGYVEIDNDGGDPMGTKNFNINFWAELFNPFQQDSTFLNDGPTNNGAAVLMMQPTGGTAYAAYQLVMCKSPNNNIRAANNTFGDPDSGNPALLTVADWTADPSVKNSPPSTTTSSVTATPAATAYAGSTGSPGGNSVFYVAAPGVNTYGDGMAQPNTGPNLPFTDPVKLQTNATTQFTDAAGTKYNSGMSYQITLGSYQSTYQKTPGTYVFMLRRLACPNLPPQTNPANAGYNPYITVDYLDGVQGYDGATQVNMAMNTPATPIAQRTSFGRKQPYTADASNVVAQKTAVANQPINTFFNPNDTLTSPFNWLVHLDRPLISPTEILQVSGFKPHELTQQFMVNGANSYSHRAPWNDQTALIYRVFEWLECKSRMAGATVGGRVAGKINLNTLWDTPANPYTFNALCDPQAGDFFNSTNVSTIYQAMYNLRTPSGSAPGGTDAPFLGYSAGTFNAGFGAYSGATGINNTFLAASTAGGNLTSQRLFELGAPGTMNPYQNQQLLNKISNHITTRSNVFAVWLTVGFFQVMDNTQNPPILGPEINLSTGQNVRHNMFAIVDRTCLTIPSTSIGTISGAVNGAGVYSVTPSSMAGITPGTILTVDAPGTKQETIIVTGVNPATSPTTFTAKFNKAHAAGCQIYSTIYGNPGPQLQFTTRDNSAVLQYYLIVD